MIETDELTYSPRADAAYIYLQREKPQKYMKRFGWARAVDYAEDGTPIGVELLDVSKGVDLADLPEPERLRETLSRFEAAIKIEWLQEEVARLQKQIAELVKRLDRMPDAEKVARALGVEASDLVTTGS